MAKVKSRDKLLELVRRSQLVAEEKLGEFVESLRSPSANKPRDAAELCELMIQARLLNQWQADNLMKGKYKGFTLGKYKLLGHLGTGGMSSVYLAEHPVMERLVAVKVLPKRFLEDQNYLDRFKREARAVAALDHPNIVRAFDIDQDGNTHYIVMEYVDGRDLQKMVKQDGPLDPIDAMDFIAQAALGLQHAHEAGLIHRDVKPANCLVDKNRCVKLLDLGLAMFSEDDRPSLSAKYDDSVVGTADYLAPEQARNSQKIDARADIYSLGCTLYFLLTGRPPFAEGSIAERLLKHQTEQPTSIYELRPETPPAVVEICRRLMIKDPNERIQKASIVADEIRSWLASRGRSITFDHKLASSASVVAAAQASSGLGSRWGRTPPPPIPGSGTSSSGLGRMRPPADETVSSSFGDTSRIAADSSLNDDLDLAPLEEDDDSGTTGSSGIHDEQPRKRSLKDGSSSSSIEDMDLERYGSGPLDLLLEDPNFKKRVQMPKTQLSTRKEEDWTDSPWVLAAVVCVLAFLAGFIFLQVLS